MMMVGVTIAVEPDGGVGWYVFVVSMEGARRFVTSMNDEEKR